MFAVMRAPVFVWYASENKFLFLKDSAYESSKCA